MTRTLTQSRHLSGYRRYVTYLTIAFFLLCLAWATSAPYFSGPDEMVHHNSVARIVGGGGWPRPYEAPVLASTRQSAVEARALRPKGGDEPPPSPSERSGLLDPGSRTERGWDRDQMVQHPPGFYVVAALPILLVGGGDLRWDIAAMLMRAVSAGLLAAALPFAIGCVSRLTRDQLAGIIGGTALVAIPFFSNMGGYVTNDSLLIAAGAAALHAAVRFTTSTGSSRWAGVDIGAALGIALFAKGYALLLIPAIVILTVLGIRRPELSSRERAVKNLGAGAAIAFGLGGWWWVRNVVVLGKLQPSVLTSYSYDDPAHSTYSFGRFLTGSAQRIEATFWGRGHVAEAALPGGFSRVATLALLGLVVAGVIWGRRRPETLALLTIPVLIAVTFLSNAHRIYWAIAESHLRIRGVQGRYLFPGLIGVAVCVGWVVVALRRFGGRANRTIIGRVVVPPVIVLPWLVSFWGMHWTVTHDRFPADRAVPGEEFQTWTGIPITWFLGLICLLVVVRVAWRVGDEIVRSADDGTITSSPSVREAILESAEG